MGQKYNLAKLFSLFLSQLTMFVEFLKEFSMLGPPARMARIERSDISALSIQTSTANMLKLRQLIMSRPFYAENNYRNIYRFGNQNFNYILLIG